MLPRKARLRKREDFNLVYKKGKLFSVKILKLFILSKDESLQRCGFSISKKISKKAVVRNKIKRRLSHAFREEYIQLKDNIDLVFVAKPEIVDQDFKYIKKSVKSLLEKAKLYTDLDKDDSQL
jgi:ribonuclease P protein component